MLPARILGIDLRSRAAQTQDGNNGHTAARKSPTISITEFRRPSMDHIKRPTLPSLGKKHGSGEKDKSKHRNGSHDRSNSRDVQGKNNTSSSKASSSLAAKPVTLAMVVESPPALFLDSPQVSSGHLLSGRLQVTPTHKDVEVTSITMYLEATVTTKRPVAERCRGCMSQVNDLYEWNFLSHPKTFPLAKGTQDLPFSHLVPGHLPATTHGQIGSIDYSLHVRARSSEGVETEFRCPLLLKRAIRATAEKTSVRVFPPTNLSLLVTIPSVVHPIGAFPVHCRMTGILTKKDDTQTRWRLRKLTWRVEESETMISPACSLHAAKVGGEGKGIMTEHKREIGNQELRGPFKTDLDDGMVEGEFEAAIEASFLPQCDMESANGLKISHSLILELVIAEEWAPNKKPQQATPTGAARVLRTQFNLIVTQRQGMGISWDDEMPPMYEDVPASPPHYKTDETRVEIYEGDDLHEDVEQLQI